MSWLVVSTDATILVDFELYDSQGADERRCVLETGQFAGGFDHKANRPEARIVF